MDTYELIEMIYEAQEKLQEAHELLNVYVAETDDRYAKAYLVDKLRIMIDPHHGFLTNDINCATLIQHLENEDE